MSVFSLPPVESIEIHGCSLVLRCVTGPAARELFIHCRPPMELTEAGAQAAAIYRAIGAVLEARGGSIASAVAEMVFMGDLARDIGAVRRARAHELAACCIDSVPPARSEIQQPPLGGAALEVLLQAVLPLESPLPFEAVSVQAPADWGDNRGARGLLVHVGEETRLHAGGLCGTGADAQTQTRSMFELAESLLQKAGMAFSDVVRTWIHLRHMERDYGDLNLARRAFLTARGIDPVPASTAIGGGPVLAGCDLSLGIYALKGWRSRAMGVMTSPTLNEAGEYGADFVRGMRVAESNKVSLLVSGTASIDEAGRTAHVGDFEAQADRMLLNLASLLQGQGADFGDVVAAITYVKQPADGARLLQKFRHAGFEGFPNAVVVAPVCRPELLCETEVIAVLPVAGG